MLCVVNQRYRYLFFYSPKAGCTSLRSLFLKLHHSELSEEQQATLNEYHNLNLVLPFDPQEDYSGYFKFYLSRNPYARAVSAFIDQYVLAQHAGVLKMLEKSPPVNGRPANFIEFLEYLKTVPDGERDGHFRTQVHFRQKIIPDQQQAAEEGALKLDYIGDISQFNQHMQAIFRRVFADHPQMLEHAKRELINLPRLNPSYYSDESHADAALLSVDALNAMITPRPQLFYNSDYARELVQEIYADDFAAFAYDPHTIPHKDASSELLQLPADFDWQTYVLLGPDLPPRGVNSLPTAVRHYLGWGRYEEDRYYKVEAPQGFDWQRYLALHPDLGATGIASEHDAIVHYLSYGKREGRKD